MTDSPSVKPIVNSNTIPIRITKVTARQLKAIVGKCNRKAHGKKVKIDAVIQKSLSLLQDAHLEEIKTATYSSQDHLEIEFKKYCQTNGQITKDQFLAILLANAIPQVSKTGNKLQE